MTKTDTLVTFKQLYEEKLTDLADNNAGKSHLWVYYLSFLYNKGTISDLQYRHWDNPYTV